MLELVLLFLASFLAATLVPAQSEALLAGLILAGHHHIYALVTVATIGNVLGSCVNWLLGRYLIQYSNRKWFPVTQEKLASSSRIYQKFGVWTLLLAWVPIIGDPLTLIAGIMHTRFLWFIVLVSIGKLARYMAIAMVL